MCFQPQRASGGRRVDACFVPPTRLIAATMDFSVVPATEGDGEFVTDLATESWRLREPQVVRIGRMSATDETGLLGN
jgi:hypothetical protein